MNVLSSVRSLQLASTLTSTMCPPDPSTMAHQLDLRITQRTDEGVRLQRVRPSLDTE